MATLSINNGNTKTTVADLNNDQVTMVIGNISLMDRDEAYLKADAYAFYADNDREWLSRFVESYEGEIVIG